jgi:hypothetical protein
MPERDRSHDPDPERVREALGEPGERPHGHPEHESERSREVRERLEEEAEREEQEAEREEGESR